MQSDILTVLLAAFPDQVQASSNSFYPAVHVAAADLLTVMAFIRDEMRLNHLANVSAVDHRDTIEVFYHLHSFQSADKLQLSVRLPGNQAALPSVFGLYPTADWQEREVFDLMGVTFRDHPDLRRILLPDDYPGHPLRKDFQKGEVS
jgi:NADH-quinone oxidoreductase subunit C